MKRRSGVPLSSGGMTLPAMCALSLAAASSTAAEGDTAQPSRVLEEITVSSTPLRGLELPIERIPGNIQRAQGEQLQRAQKTALAQFLDSSFGSVFINEAQNNLLQPDLQFRGFVASPLLGQPQGIAVYQNGVRINDPFGDTVNWALVPEGAIATADLIPGSNPVFGLNALGGALSLRTKNGFTDAGTQTEVMAGSFGRAVASIQSGGTLGHSSGERGFSYYGNARYMTEDGWRDHSPTDALHLFGDIGWRGNDASLALSLTRVETDLIGNGPAPIQLLEIEREAIYTHPDRTENSMTLAMLTADYTISPAVELNAVAHFRRSNIDTLNGDESDFEPCEEEGDEAFVCEGDDEDELALDVDGAPIPFGPAVDGATLNRSSTDQDTYGATLQVGMSTPIAGRDNRLTFGGSYDHSNVRFSSNTELGSFDDGRGAIAGGAFVGESFVDLRTRVENASVFLTDTFALTSSADLTVSARYNDTSLKLRDQLGEELNGDHAFSRFNGAAGISYRFTPQLRVYASYSESNRAPSPVELTCADEDDPCALPNAFLSDPPLEQVVAHTSELGAHGLWQGLRWHAGLFRTDNDDDILFISSGALTNRGFFDNVGDTRREGIEINLSGKAVSGRLSWFANYTALRAEFRESFTVMSPNNPSATDGEIAVREGSRIPGVSEHLLSAGAELAVTDAITVRLDGKYRSDQHLRGDEGNLESPLGGYTVLDLSAQWQLSSALTLFARVENVLDSEHETFGLYGAADEVLGDEFDDPRFVSPAAPRSAWIGIRWIL